MQQIPQLVRIAGLKAAEFNKDRHMTTNCLKGQATYALEGSVSADGCGVAKKVIIEPHVAAGRLKLVSL